MLRLLAVSAILFYGFGSNAQCVYCTSMDEALRFPKKVKQLDLRAQGLVELPDSLSSFVNLQSLDLSTNFIETIDFETISLPQLKQLTLSYNPTFNAMNMDKCAEALPNLEALELDHCNITFVSPEVGKLKNLIEINLSNNFIPFLPAEISQASKLSYIDLENNRLEDVFFLRDLWNVKELKTSGNAHLDAREIGAGFLFKDSIEQITLNPSNNGEKLPDEFEDVDVSTLVLKGGDLSRYNFKICRNESIKCIIADGTSISNTAVFVSWVNKFPKLEYVEFKNLSLSQGLKDIKVKTIAFTNCELKQISELKQIDRSVQIVANNTDISDGKYTGNAIKTTDQETGTAEAVNAIMPMAEEMLENNLEPIVEPTPEIFNVDSKKRNWVQMEASAYNIPENAFLRKDGSLYEGEVELKITEFTDPIINALAGVPMVMNTNDRNELFASNGMIEFRAYDDKGNELQPNPENIIQVQLKDIQPGQPSNLYVYNEETSNWDTIGQPEASNYDELYNSIMDSLNKIPDQDLVNVKVVQRPIYMKYKKSRKDPYQLDFFTIGSRKQLRRIEDGKTIIHTGNLDQEWLCRKVNWKIDTVITDQTKEFLKDVKVAQKKAQKYWTKKHANDFYFAPRMIKELSIVPNFENDNYTMTFMYRDSLVQYPVYPTFGGSVRKVQEKEKRNYKEYEKNVRLSTKENDLIKRHRKEGLKKMADAERSRRATAQVNMQKIKDGVIKDPYMMGAMATVENDMEEYNRFGLDRFGLVNCDYFSRNIPDDFIAFDTVGVDERGDFVRMPNTIRNIYLDDNSFVTTRSDMTPVFKQRRSIAMIVLSSVEIAIIRGWNQLKNGKSRPDVQRINIKGMSSSEVRRNILGVD